MRGRARDVIIGLYQLELLKSLLAVGEKYMRLNL